MSQVIQLTLDRDRCKALHKALEFYVQEQSKLFDKMLAGTDGPNERVDQEYYDAQTLLGEVGMWADRL